MHIADLREDEAYIRGYPPLKAVVESGGGRTLLVVPMLKDNALVGAIAIYTQEVQPFSDKQIDLVTTLPSRRSSRSKIRACSTNCAVAAARPLPPTCSR